ncbi:MULTISPECIES: ComEC/Rec2 family competence protein [Caproicibacterium]|uniref:ComEC/Rec2 family competence protein n=1 Tax=Caproicibacterium argilliputei TaxID=3030016 RepID=A0AA97D962_9FIRM|nr:ComEC/Rec2 family competence protein [Caproicibacterium argilliputei]WOC32049.1 ComEC/Rec2 family competence protein [Caproicibacterium argilliputei]
MKKILRLLAAVLAPVLLLSGCQLPEDAAALNPRTNSSTASEATASAAALQKKASIWYFDVGQGDSELLQLPDGKTVLIDSGTSESAKGLVKLLKGLNISKLDIVIATHPHADHIGGMLQVLRNFEIGQYVMPRVADDDVPTTKLYTNLLKEMKKKKITATQAKAGLTLLNESGCSITLLAPKKAQYTKLNNYSAVAMVTIGAKKFLFTGDAEKESEQEMVKSGVSLHADVLKCGHHGSKTSTTTAFLKAVSPTAAVISCGRGNDYGFPAPQTLSHLKSAGVKIYRTDEQKTICAQTDGKTISFETGLASATHT